SLFGLLDIVAPEQAVTHEHELACPRGVLGLGFLPGLVRRSISVSRINQSGRRWWGDRAPVDCQWLGSHHGHKSFWSHGWHGGHEGEDPTRYAHGVIGQPAPEPPAPDTTPNADPPNADPAPEGSPGDMVCERPIPMMTRMLSHRCRQHHCRGQHTCAKQST